MWVLCFSFTKKCDDNAACIYLLHAVSCWLAIRVQFIAGEWCKPALQIWSHPANTNRTILCHSLDGDGSTQVLSWGLYLSVNLHFFDLDHKNFWYTKHTHTYKKNFRLLMNGKEKTFCLWCWKSGGTDQTVASLSDITVVHDTHFNLIRPVS